MQLLLVSMAMSPGQSPVHGVVQLRPVGEPVTANSVFRSLVGTSESQTLPV